MAITFWDFINQGGKVFTSSGYRINNIILTPNTNPYPITGTIQFTDTISQTINWDANGNPQVVGTDTKLYLVPIKTTTVQYLSANTTLATVNSYAQWVTVNNTTAGVQ